MKPKRIQRKRTKGWRMPENAVYVGRPTKWGNPYTLNMYENLSDVMFCFEHYARLKSEKDPEWLRPLRGKSLACWCPLDQPCHADVLLELAND